MDIYFFILLLAASAFFSSSETAFLSLDKIRLRQFEAINHPSGKRVVKLLLDPHKLLITILIGNTLVNIAASAVLADFFYSIMGEKGIAVSIAAMTVMILIFGEVTPKMFALSNKETVSIFAALPLKVLGWLFTPFRLVLDYIARSIINGFGLRLTSESEKMTKQEIRSLFSVSKKKGVVKAKEKDMIEGILEFKDSNAADIMTPRIGISALDLTMERCELIKEVKENQFSRYPVYVHTLDNIVGIVHSKDLLLDKNLSVRDIVKKPFFAPESMKIDGLLQELQKKRLHMAIITDEYGVTSGIVTVEDILEEVVGEIKDEFDFELPKVRKIDRKRYEVSGQAHIDEVNEKIGLSIETEEVDTIGGYVTLKIGKIPRSGDMIKVGKFSIIVNDVSKNRITSVTVSRE
ncbi:MAG: hemolysin family protein [Candidatus Omnitrophota bacterium]